MPSARPALLAALLAACASASPRSGPAPAPAAAPASPASRGDAMSTALPYEVFRGSLPNGLRVLVLPMPSDGLASWWSIVRTGSRDEVEPGVTGFAHFFEHMMFRGSETIPADEYNRIVTALGADANAYTTDDYTAYYLTFASEDLHKVAVIEADRFQRLAYDEGAFKTEAGAVYGEYRKGRTSPWEVLEEAVQDTAFDRHTYQHTTIGFEADIARMPTQYAYSRSFFERFYRPDNVVLVVAGDVDPAEVMAAVEAEYGAWKPGYEPPDVPVEPEQTAPRRVDVPFDGQTLPFLAVMFKAPAFSPADRTAVAGTTLGELAFGETSPLYRRLVLDEQRVEALYPMFGDNRDPGLWGVVATVKDPADVRAVEAEIWRTVDGLRAEPVDGERLDAVRAHLKYGFLSRLSTPSDVAGSLARVVALTGDVEAVETRFATLDAVTPADVQAAVRRYLDRARSTVATLHTRGQAIPEAAPEAAAPAAALPPLAEPPVLLPVAQDPNVALAVWVKVGSQDDPPGKEGLAALTAAMVGEAGTARLSYEAILERLFPMAGAYGVSVDREMTVVRGSVHRDHAVPFARLFAEAITEPAFREDDFERLRDEAVSYLENTLRYSSDEELGKAALYAAAFAGTPYAHLETGTVASLKALTLEDVRAFWRTHYTRSRLVLAVGGAYPADLPERLHAALAALPEGAPPSPPVLRVPPVKGRHVTMVEKPGPSTAISFGFPLDVRRGEREFYALWLANSWLGEHRNGVAHLFQVIREARGMNYGDYSYIEAFPEGGRRQFPPTGVGRRRQLFEVWIRPVPEGQALFALRAGLREVERLAREGLTPEQFEAHRAFLEKYVLHFAETTAERLGYAVDDRFYGLDDHLARFREVLRDLTVDEVNAAVRKHLQADDLHIALVTEHAAAMKKALVAGAPSPLTYPEGVVKPEEQLAEDAVIATWPLAIDAKRVRIVPVGEMFAR